MWVTSVTTFLVAASGSCVSLAFASEVYRDETCIGSDAPQAEAEEFLQMFQSAQVMSLGHKQQVWNGAGALAKDKLVLEDALLEDDASVSSSECHQRNVAEQQKVADRDSVHTITLLVRGISEFLSLFQDVAWFAVGFAAFLIWRGFSRVTEDLSKPKEPSQPKDVPKKVAKQAEPVHASASVLEVDALVQAMYSDNKDDLRKFLDARSVNACDEVGCCTALHVAAHYSCHSAAEALLARGADANVRDVWDETPLHFAARAGKGEICTLLLNGRADANASNMDGCTPLIAAATAKKADVCELLLDNGAHAGGAAEEDVPPLLQSILARRIMCGATQVTEES